MNVICLCATARTKTTTAASTDSLSLCLFVSFFLSSLLVFLFSSLAPYTSRFHITHCFLLPVLPAPAAPHPCPFTLTVSLLYAYSNKGFMYCHNMINAVFAKGNYCQQKGRATHEVITTDHCSSCSSRSATYPHPEREHQEIDL